MIRQGKHQRRRGSVLLEAILAIPVLVLLSFAAVQYGETIVYEQAVGAAADEGAREAAKGADADDVAEVVQTMLSPFGLTVAMGSGVRVDIEQAVAPVSETRGDATVPAPPSINFTTPPPGSLETNEVRVTVQILYPATNAPNLLGYFGIDFSSKRFQYSALARNE